MNNARVMGAEAFGTMVLMLGGPGTAVFAGGDVGILGVALGFGLALLIAAYAIGPISGCHINPAVTIGLAAARKIQTAAVPVYIVGQVIGAVLGGLVIWVLRNGFYDDFDANPLNFATNLWGAESGFANFGAMALTEILLTALLVVVVLSTTRRNFPPAAIGLAVGLTLTVIHLISIPIDNTSVNPARSLGMAVFAGGDAIEQLWAFIVFPVLGALLGVLIWLMIDDASLEDTMLARDGLVDLRDSAAGVTSRAADAVGGGTGDAGAAGATPSTATEIASFAATSTDTRTEPYGIGSLAPLADPREVPEGYPIKGNVDSMLYHRPDSRNYGATVAEVYFDTSERAESAGFGLASTHPDVDMTRHPYGVGSHAPIADDAMPEGYSIKGNVDSMLYHRPDSRNYGATVAEVWFDTPERAEAAGFGLARTHPSS